MWESVENYSGMAEFCFQLCFSLRALNLGVMENNRVGDLHTLDPSPTIKPTCSHRSP